MTGYTRNDTADNIADGKVINASDLDGEFNAVQAAFDATAGHTHDGTTGGGAQIDYGDLANLPDLATAAITGGAIDGATIGATTPASGAFTALSASGNVTLSGGTANGVAYLNGSKVLTSGSALTFDGTKLTNTASAGGVLLEVISTGSSPEVSITSADTGISRINFGGATTPKKGAFVFSDNSNLFYWLLSNGSEAMRLTATGLGIGTSSPSQRLDVWSGTASSAVAQFTGTNAGRGLKISTALVNTVNDAGVILDAQQASGVLMLATGGTERLRIDSSGNLGLGVTPSAWQSGFTAFDVGSSSALIDGGTSTRILHNAYINSIGNPTYKNTAASALFGLYGNEYRFYQASSGTAGNAISFTQAMTLNASGNLGIGTSSPGEKFVVANAAGSVAAQILAGATGTSNLYFADGTTGADNYTGFIQYNHSTNAMNFGTNGGTIRATIDSSGNLLVGKTSSSANGDGAQLFPSGTVGLGHTSGTVTGTAYAAFGYAGGGIGSITQSGTTGVSYNTSSDYRLKDNIQDITGSGAFIDALQPRTWNWKADGSAGAGFIAHELQAVSPSSVVGEKDAVDADGNPEYQAVEYGSAEVIAMLVAEVKSLRARLTAAGL